jgi:dethiobiotin synthetase/adenosylmethionine--8-amino-7-oxononanoate aminotransferase
VLGPCVLQCCVQVIALENNYHGDTLGAMDCASASPFNGPLQSPWYSPRGLFLDPPYVSLSKGVWRVELPAWLHESVLDHGVWEGVSEGDLVWDTQADAFSPERAK